ncbi:PAS domain S-box protein [Balneolaceae bacterium ANBcel3]|nr:PAS domain S-box protein [Balneolaceae bacterium ANBcel3]
MKNNGNNIEAESDSVFLPVLEEVAEAVILLNQKGHIYWMNHASREVFGHHYDQVIGEQAPDIFTEENDQPLSFFRVRKTSVQESRIKRGHIHLAGKKPITYTGKLVSLPGKTEEYRWMLLFNIPERLENQLFRTSLDTWADTIKRQLMDASSPGYVSFLKRISLSFHADRSYILVYPEAQKKGFTERQMVEWVRKDAGSEVASMHGDAGRFSRWWKEQLLKGAIMFYEDIHKLPPEAGEEREFYEEAGVKSTYVYPFQSRETGCVGFVGIDWIRNRVELTESEKGMLAMIMETLSAHIIRKRAEDKLRMSEGRFRTLIQNSADVLMVLSPEFQFLFLSPSVERVLGYDPDQLVGQSILQFIHHDDQKTLKHSLSKVLEGGTESLVTEHRFRHKDGHWVYLESVGSNLVQESIVGGMVINARDVTDRKRVEEELVRARDSAEEMNRVKTALLANMSHEMRTPLTGILGFAGILEADLPEGEARGMATRIHISGRRLLETIESILDLAKLESEEIEIQMENVNLINEVLRAMDNHMKSASQKRIRFEMVTELEDLYMDVDRQLFSRIMYNLLSNAFKYTDDGEVTIHVSRFIKREREWVQVDVQDTGIGISPDFLPKVFDEFQQESTGLSRKFEGSGLGLTITKKLVEALDGSISANSKKGVGSIFTVQLPISSEAKSGEKHTKAVRVPPRLKRKKPRILVVEDDFDSSVIAKFYLGKDYEVETTESGEQALKRLKEDTFQMVILDISLGAGMDGIATLQSIRENSLWANMPVIALTAHALGGDEEYYLAQGFSGYLAKPFKKDELLDLVSMLLKQ